MNEWLKGQNRVVLAISAVLTIALIVEAATVSPALAGAFILLAAVWALMVRRSVRRRRI